MLNRGHLTPCDVIDKKFNLWETLQNKWSGLAKNKLQGKESEGGTYRLKGTEETCQAIAVYELYLDPNTNWKEKVMRTEKFKH